MSTIKPIDQSRGASERRRIPMSTPVQKLEVAEIPGYHLHWFNGTPERLQRALDGGYEYVDEREVKTNAASLGSDTAISGNTDMGSRVSIVSGQESGKDGQPVRLILMKIKQEWWDEDQKQHENRNSKVRDTLLGGMVGAEQDRPGDTQHRYVDQTRTQIPDFFKLKRPKQAA
tara:strand:- start:177 stop:695 length:519 start_codon:yes stop_codon:yes gene_type:complete